MECNDRFNESDLVIREQKLANREHELAMLEKELNKKEKAMKEKEKAKKQILLRLAPSLWNDLAIWAEEDFRSINGQIEYLLALAVKNHRKK
jgi:hypothetical protein